jgi:interleukin enhancer-binding factor 2
VTKVKQVLEKMIDKPDDFPAAIEEVREVGSFKKGTMLAKNNIADLVVILKSLPTGEIKNFCKLKSF